MEFISLMISLQWKIIDKGGFQFLVDFLFELVSESLSWMILEVKRAICESRLFFIKWMKLSENGLKFRQTDYLFGKIRNIAGFYLAVLILILFLLDYFTQKVEP